jgi:hypothetical protein
MVSFVFHGMEVFIRIYVPAAIIDDSDQGIPEDDDPLCIQKRHSQNLALGKRKHPAAVTDDEAIAFALRRIQLLEKQFDHTEQSIKEIREHEKLRNSKLAPPRKQNDGCKLVHALERIHELEFRFGWIRNSIHEIEEYLGFDTFPYPRLEHRWEGPPPDTFRYHGLTFYDVRPIVVTPTGPAGRPSLVPEPTEKNGRWVVVTRDNGSIEEQGEEITIGILSLVLRFYDLRGKQIRGYYAPVKREPTVNQQNKRQPQFRQPNHQKMFLPPRFHHRLSRPQQPDHLMLFL